jgi:hypothetical protein
MDTCSRNNCFPCDCELTLRVAQDQAAIAVKGIEDEKALAMGDD